MLAGIRGEWAAISVLFLLVLLIPRLRKPILSGLTLPVQAKIPPLHQREIEVIVQAVQQGESLLIVGEQGSGKSTILTEVQTRTCECFSRIAIATYIGSLKATLLSIGEQLDIPLTKPRVNGRGETVGETPMSTDEMREELSANMTGCLLLVDDAHNFPKSLLLWFELLHKAGNKILLFSITDPAKGIFLRLGKLEISSPTDLQIRDIMVREAIACGLSLSPSRLAALQRRVGKNLMLAKKVIRDESLGISSGIEHRDYVDISPLIMGFIVALSIVRFIGIGMGDRALFAIGGMSFSLGVLFKLFGRWMSKNARQRRLGT